MSTNQQTQATNLVLAASPTAIEDSLQVVAKRMRRWNRWLTTRHRYNKDIVQTLTQDIQQNAIDGRKLGEYIASSVPLHLSDGWNYLSRAFDASSRGDRGSTCHLAYYAELRAAMSLLAAEGIGIFNNRHVALDDKFQPTVYRGGTHEATWMIFSSWAQEQDKAEGLLQSIYIETENLSHWLQIVGVGSPAQQFVAKKWLNAWSVDLDAYNDDRDRRNETSYRPTRIRVPSPLPVDPIRELSDPIFNSWSELDPEVVGGRAAIDLALLRNAIQLVVDEGACSYTSLEKALDALGQYLNANTVDALRTESPTATAIFKAAAIEDFQGKPATPILARALLMLRLASARAASLLAAASISREDLKFWWLPMGTDLGWWDVPEEDELLNIWGDVSAAWEEAEDRLDGIPGESSVQFVSGILSRDVSLTQFSRAPLWLLGLS